MIVLNINGRDIQLPVGYTLSREIESNLLKRDGDVSDFNYPISIPLTDDNIITLGFPTNLNAGIYKKEYTAGLYIDGYYVRDATITIQKVDFEAMTCSVAISGSYSPFTRLFGSKTLNNMFAADSYNDPIFFPYVWENTYGVGVNDITEDYSYTHVFDTASPGSSTQIFAIHFFGTDLYSSFLKNVSNGTVVAPYAFPTCMDTNMNVPTVNDTGTVNILNGYDQALEGGYIQGIRHFLRTLFTTTEPGSAERHYMVPMFKLGWVLSKLFTLNGLTVTGAIFSDPKFTNTLLYNTYTITTCFVSFGSSINNINITDATSHYINPDNHMPDIKVVDFLASIAQRYNLQYLYNEVENSINIICLNGGLNNLPNILDISEYVVNNPKVDFVAADALRGYNFGFSQVPGNANIKDVSDKPVLEAVNHRDLITAVSGGYSYIRNENKYFDVDSLVSYDNLGDYANTALDGLQEMKTAATSMVMDRIDVNNRSGGSNMLYSNVLMPASNIGIYGENLLGWDNGLGVQFGVFLPVPFFSIINAKPNPGTFMPMLVSWFGFQNYNGSFSYPFAGTMPYDNQGNDLTSVGYPQIWNNPDKNDLYNIFWKNFSEQIQSGFSMEQDAKIPPHVYAKLDINSTLFYLNCQRYIAQKATFNTPYPQVSTLSLTRG